LTFKGINQRALYILSSILHLMASQAAILLAETSLRQLRDMHYTSLAVKHSNITRSADENNECIAKHHWPPVSFL